LTNRPTYQQRRETQLAKGADPIKPKKNKLSLLWVPCSPRAGNTENNPALNRAKSQRATCFTTLEAAQAAEQENFERCGYHEQDCRMSGALRTWSLARQTHLQF